MIKRDNDYIKCTITPLTAIHIGNGEEIYPYEYVVKNGYLYRFNFETLLNSLPKNHYNEFIKLLENSDIIKIRSFIKKIYKEEYGYTYKVKVSCDFAEIYEKKIEGSKARNEENSLFIFEFSGNHRGKVLAGSTIKGAIRSAYIGEKTQKFNYKITFSGKSIKHTFVDENEDKKLTSNALGLFKFEPKYDFFKNIIVTDSSIYSPEEIIEVSQAKRISIKNPKGMPVGYHEVLKGLFTSGSDIKLESTINLKSYNYEKELLNKIYNNEKNYNDEEEKDIIKEKKDIYIDKDIEDGILSILNNKAVKMLDEDIKFFEKIGDKTLLENCKKLKIYNENLKDNEVLIRFGKGSGFNSTTINLYNKSKISTVTRTIMENYPMGWAVLSVEE